MTLFGTDFCPPPSHVCHASWSWPYIRESFAVNGCDLPFFPLNIWQLDRRESPATPLREREVCTLFFFLVAFESPVGAAVRPDQTHTLVTRREEEREEKRTRRKKTFPSPPALALPCPALSTYGEKLSYILENEIRAPPTSARSDIRSVRNCKVKMPVQ